MEKSVCICCYKPKAKLACGVCSNPVCKNCVQFVDEENFSFFQKMPIALTYKTYCVACFDAKVGPEQEKYNSLMEQAKNVSVFFKDQGKETSRMRRIEKPLRVRDCRDRDETVLRLAFFAAMANFNTIIDVDVSSTQVRNMGYQTSSWSGMGIPIQLEECQRAGRDFTGG